MEQTQKPKEFKRIYYYIQLFLIILLAISSCCVLHNMAMPFLLFAFTGLSLFPFMIIYITLSWVCRKVLKFYKMFYVLSGYFILFLLTLIYIILISQEAWTVKLTLCFVFSSALYVMNYTLFKTKTKWFCFILTLVQISALCVVRLLYIYLLSVVGIVPLYAVVFVFFIVFHRKVYNLVIKSKLTLFMWIRFLCLSLTVISLRLFICETDPAFDDMIYSAGFVLIPSSAYS